jgi:predicted hydrocarbon binding protein
MKMGIKNKLIHLIQLLHLKTNADIKKVEREIMNFEKKFGSQLHYIIQSYLVDIYIYEYLKRELINEYKTILTKAPYEYAKEKFYKDSKLDRETIGNNLFSTEKLLIL